MKIKQKLISAIYLMTFLGCNSKLEKSRLPTKQVPRKPSFKILFVSMIFLMVLNISFAQGQNWFIETSVFRNNYKLKDVPSFLKVHKNSNINGFKHQFSLAWDSSSRNYEYDNGEYKLKNSSTPVGLIQADYRQIIVGKNMVLKSTRKSVINSSIGFNFSQLDIQAGNLLEDSYIHYSDSTNSFGTDSNFSLNAFHQNRRLGFNYSVDYSIKLRKFKFGIGGRLGAHFAISDKTTLIYSEKTFHLSPFKPGFNDLISRYNLNIYNDDRPFLGKQEFVVIERKPTLFLDFTVYLKAEYVLFDKIGFYAIWGLTPYTKYYRKAQRTDSNKLNSLFGFGVNIQIIK